MTFPCCKESNDVKYNRWCQHFLFNLQPTLNRLFNSCVKLYWYLISCSRNMKDLNWRIDASFSQKKLPSKRPVLSGLKVNSRTKTCSRLPIKVLLQQTRFCLMVFVDFVYFSRTKNENLFFMPEELFIYKILVWIQ